MDFNSIPKKRIFCIVQNWFSMALYGFLSVFQCMPDFEENS